MRNVLFIACVLGLLSSFPIAAAQSSAAETKTNALGEAAKIEVAVDPRFELTSLIFRLAGLREYNRCTIRSYRNQADAYFRPYFEHDAVLLAQDLFSRRSVSYDAPMSLAAHLTGEKKLTGVTSFDPPPSDLDSRWAATDANAFVAKMNAFAEESHFNKFFSSHQKFYEASESRLKDTLRKKFRLEWFNEFFGARPNAKFTLVIGLLNGGNSYGPRCRTPDGKERLYCVLGVWNTDADDLPVFDDEAANIVIHEFCHSFANPIIDSHLNELRASGEKLHSRVADALRRQNYGDWQTMMRESLVRASTLRYIRRYGDDESYSAAVQQELKNQFLWIEGLSDLLETYEKSRERYPTLESFAPQIVRFFDAYAEEHPK